MQCTTDALEMHPKEFPGGSVVRTLALLLLRAWVPSQVGELKHLTSRVAWSGKKKKSILRT